MVKRRLLLPYGVAGDTVIPLTLDELKWILRDVNVDAIDVSRYPNPDTFGYETAYKACNGTKKIYTDIKYNEYGLLYDLIPVCNNTIANRFNIRNIATIIDHKTLGFYRVINTEIPEEKSDTFGTPEYYDNMIIRRKVVGGINNDGIEITPLRTDGMYMVPVRPRRDELDGDDHTTDEVVFVPNSPQPPNLVFPPPSL